MVEITYNQINGTYYVDNIVGAGKTKIDALWSAYRTSKECRLILKGLGVIKPMEEVEYLLEIAELASKHDFE
jgi:hypothetical protein